MAGTHRSGHVGSRHEASGAFVLELGLDDPGIERSEGGDLPGRPIVIRVTEKAQEGRLATLRLLRQVGDRIDRDHAMPLDVDALAREDAMSSGHLSRQFRTPTESRPTRT